MTSASFPSNVPTGLRLSFFVSLSFVVWRRGRCHRTGATTRASSREQIASVWSRRGFVERCVVRYLTCKDPESALSAVSTSPDTTDALPVAVYVPLVAGSVHGIVVEPFAPAARVTVLDIPAVPALTERETVKVSDFVP